MKYLTIVILALLCASINAQENANCNIYDPLLDSEGYIDELGLADPCCGLEDFTMTSYNVPTVDDNPELYSYSLNYFTYNNQSWAGNIAYLGSIDYGEWLTAELNDICVNSFGLDEGLFECNSDGTVIKWKNAPTGFGNVTLAADEDAIGIPVNYYEWECPYQDSEEFDIDEFSQVDESTDLENIDMFGTDTETIANSIDNDGPGYNGNQIGYLMNYIANQGGFNFTSGCFNINCIDMQNAFMEGIEVNDGNFEYADDELNDELESHLEGTDADPSDVLQAVSVELASIDFVALLNENFNLGILPIDCGDGTTPLQGGGDQNGLMVNGLMPPDDDVTPDGGADVNYYSNEIAGLGASQSMGAASAQPSSIVSGGVDLFNGAQQSNIPLHQLVSRDISVPIGLSSSNNGLKVNDVGSQVGQNWNVNAGGSITRVVNGYPDEFQGVVEAEAVGRIKRAHIRYDLLPSTGVNIKFSALPDVLETPCFKVRDGFLLGEHPPSVFPPLPSPPAQIRFTWDIQSPGMVYLTFVVSIPITVFGVNLDIQLSLGTGAGLMISPDHGKYEIIQNVTGFSHLPSDIENKLQNLISLSSQEKIDILEDLHEPQKAEQAAFFSSKFSGANDFLDFITGDLNKIENDVYDIEPDEYFFNLEGYSGKFIKDYEGNIQTFPFQPDLIVEEVDQSGFKFKIVLPNGMEYYYGGTSESEELTKNTSYYLPNFYTYPEIGLGRNKFGMAEIDVQHLEILPEIGLGINIPYSSTFNRNYRITKNPQYISAWKVRSIRSSKSLEEVSFEYGQVDNLRYTGNRSYNHNFPYIAGQVANPTLRTKANFSQNPLDIKGRKWANGRAEFSMNVVESNVTRNLLTQINNTRGESITFEYEQERVEIMGAHLLDKISVLRSGEFYKGWQLKYDYEISDQISTIECEEVVNSLGEFTESPIKVSYENNFHLGDYYSPVDYQYFFYSRFNLAVQGFNIPTNFPFPYIPSLTPNAYQNEMGELSSLLFVKGLSTEFLEYDEETGNLTDLEIFNRESNFSFLKQVLLIDKANQNSDSTEDLPIVAEIEYNNLENKPKRFSIHQNELGYALNNPSGSPLPRVHPNVNIDGDEAGTSSFEYHFPMHNIKFPNGNFYYPPLQNSETDLTLPLSGSISSITGETGQQISYDYDLITIVATPTHLGQLEMIAGLKVVELTNSTAESPSLTKRFNYAAADVVDNPLNFYSNLYEHYTKFGLADNKESKFHTQSVPFNNIPNMKGNLVGFGEVTEEVDGFGSSEHYFSTAISTDHVSAESRSSSFFDIYQLAIKSKYATGNLQNVSSYESKPSLSFYPEKYNNSHIGIEYKSVTKNDFGDILSQTENFYDEVSAGQVFKGLESEVFQYNHYGSFIQNYLYNTIKQYLHLIICYQASGIIEDILDYLFNLIFNIEFEHPFKYIERNHQVNTITLIPTNVRLIQSKSEQHFLEAGNTSMAAQSDYFYADNNFTIPKSVVKTTGASSFTTTNYFVGDALPDNVNSYFPNTYETFYNSRNIRTPLASMTTRGTNDTGVKLGFSCTVPEFINDRIVPKYNFGLRAGNIFFQGKFDDHNTDGLPLSYYLAKYETTPSSGISGFFDPIEFIYNSRLQIEERTYKDMVATNNYDETFFHLTSTLDNEGVSTLYEYDDRWRLKTLIGLNGKQTQVYNYELGPNNNKVSTELSFTDMSKPAQITSTEYDGVGRQLRVYRTNDNALLQWATYDALGRTTSSYQIGAGVTTISHEPALISNKTTTTDASGVTMTSIKGGTIGSYFSHEIIRDGKGYETVSYSDVNGLQRLVRDAGGGETTYNFDEFNRLHDITNPIGEQFIYEYNAIDKPHEITIPHKGTTEVWWDHNFRPVVLQDANGNIIVSEHDDYNRVIKTGLFETLPAVGESVDIVMQDLATISEANLLTKVTFNSTSSNYVSESVERIFDKDGMSDFQTTQNIGLDDLGRPSEITVQNPFYSVTSTPSYNDALLTENLSINFGESDPMNHSFFYEFDDLLRPVDTRVLIKGKMNHISKILYNSQDQVSGKLLGVNGNSGLQKIDYKYDSAGKLLAINEPKTTTCNLGTFCDFNLTLFQNGKIKCNDPSLPFDCNQANGFFINGTFYQFDEVIDVYTNFDELKDLLVEKLDFLGINFESIEAQIIPLANNVEKYTLTVRESDVEEVRLSWADCAQSLPFMPHNCEDFEESINLSGPHSINPDLYMQKNWYSQSEISKIEIDGYCEGGKIRNEYAYDMLYRLTGVSNTIFAGERIDGRYNSSYQYDAAGNILSLRRQGLLESGDYGSIDNLIYAYPEINNNFTLKTISDKSGSIKGQQGKTSFTYDNNGNLLSDQVKQLTNIEYTPSNLPTRIDIKGQSLEFVSTYGGQQLKKVSSAGIRIYKGGGELLNGQPQFLSLGDSRYNFTSQNFEYFIGDHLGNNVVVFTDANKDGIVTYESIATEDKPNEVLQRNFYYAFGMNQEGWEPSEDIPALALDPENSYLYNGKELHKDEDLGWLNYGFRFYDPAIARFTTVDPLTEQFSHQSGYVYADNDPVGKIDFMGLNGQKADDYYKNLATGNVEWHKGSGYKEGYEHLHEDRDMALWKSGIRDQIGYTDNSVLGPVKEKPSSESIKRSGGGAGYAWARSLSGEENIALRAGRSSVTLGDYQESQGALGTGVMLMMPYGRMAKGLFMGGVGLLGKVAPNAGISFKAYKAARGGTGTLAQISTSTGVQRISIEFHHAIIPQRMQRAMNLPNWMVNNRVNVWRLNTVQHALIDPHRKRLLRAGFKPDFGWTGRYNWFTKF